MYIWSTENNLQGRDPIWDPEAELGIRLAAPSLPTRSSFWSLWLQV